MRTLFIQKLAEETFSFFKIEIVTQKIKYIKAIAIPLFSKYSTLHEMKTCMHFAYTYMATSPSSSTFVVCYFGHKMRMSIAFTMSSAKIFAISGQGLLHYICTTQQGPYSTTKNSTWDEILALTLTKSYSNTVLFYLVLQVQSRWRSCIYVLYLPTRHYLFKIFIHNWYFFAVQKVVHVIKNWPNVYGGSCCQCSSESYLILNTNTNVRFVKQFSIPNKNWIIILELMSSRQ